MNGETQLGSAERRSERSTHFCFFIEKKILKKTDYFCSRKHFCATTCLKECAIFGWSEEEPSAVLGTKILSVFSVHVSSQFFLLFDLTNHILFNNQRLNVW